MERSSANDRRVLIADDNEDIRNDVARVLGGASRRIALAAREARLFPPDEAPAASFPVFEVVVAASGEEALGRARAARQAGHPIALAFVDVRMPPGIDGARVARILREEDPDIEVVLITAYADRTLGELNAGKEGCDRLLFLRKPYAHEEISQLALSLTEKRFQRREARRRRDQLELVLASTRDGLLGLDAEHRVVFANSAARELLGLTDAAAEANVWSALAAAKPHMLVPGATIELSRGGRWLELSEVAATGATEGAVRGVIALRDVTARKEVERLKDEFVQNTSHELRTPLVSIRGYLDLALEERLGTLAPPLRKGLEVARRSSARLLDLIDALLELARLDVQGSRAETGPVDLAQVLERTMDGVRLAADAKGLSVELELAPDARAVVADPRTLEVALRNLLGNAVKFTESGSVGVSARRTGGRVAIEVWDTGPGLPPGVEPATLFERFRQGEGGMARTKGGVGIGLSLVERILRLHGRSVLAQDRPGGGASFSFELDAAGPDTFAPRPREPATRAAGSVLVIDPSRTTREFVRFVAGANGQEVVAAADAEEALANPETAACSVALVDAGENGEGARAAEALLERLGPHAPRVALMRAAGRRPPLAPGPWPCLEKPLTLGRVSELTAPVPVGRLASASAGGEKRDVAA
jgi:signal transduction histidine kinase/DNA-binding NarL/FixJ family response regulator